MEGRLDEGLHYRQRIDGTGLTTGTRYAIKAQYKLVLFTRAETEPARVDLPGLLRRDQSRGP